MTSQKKKTSTRRRRSSGRTDDPRRSGRAAPRRAEGPGPVRTLRADDPGELLAEATLSLGAAPSSCMILIGHSGRTGSPVTTRVDLRSALGESSAVDMENLLRAMRDAGCTGAFGVVVLGDGREDPVDEEGVVEGVGVCARMLMTARHHRPRPFDLPEMWVLAQGEARRVLLEEVRGHDGGSYDLGIGEPTAISPLASTLVAAEAVACGIALPMADPRGDRHLQDALGDARAQRGRSPILPARLALDRAAAAVGSIRRGSAETDPQRYVTDCERLAGLLDVLSSELAAEEVIAALLPPPHRGSAAEDGVIPAILDDSRLRPQESIRAGGTVYRMLEQVRSMLRPRGEAPLRHEDLEAWAGCTEVLAVLSWWNHRHATSGALAEELLAVMPRHPLALCLAEMTMVPISPAWRPTRQGTR